MDAHVDWSDWPLLEIRAAALPVAGAPALISRGLQEALDRAEPFAAVVHMPDPDAAGARKAGALERVRMVKRLRPGLREHCRGLAFVASQQALRDGAKAIKSGDRIWGCATFTASDPQQARDWARGRLTAHGPEVR